jgi:hypothetical protein
MIDKEFVPYEEAFALKELGFNEPCLGYYLCRNSAFGIDDLEITTERIDLIRYDYASCAVPTYAQAFRWFRENHNLRCQINYIGGLINKTTWWDISVIGHYNTDPKEWEMKYQPYEEAELACLRKLIEIVKTK